MPTARAGRFYDWAYHHDLIIGSGVNVAGTKRAWSRPAAPAWGWAAARIHGPKRAEGGAIDCSPVHDGMAKRPPHCFRAFISLSPNEGGCAMRTHRFRSHVLHPDVAGQRIEHPLCQTIPIDLGEGQSA